MATLGEKARTAYGLGDLKAFHEIMLTIYQEKHPENDYDIWSNWGVLWFRGGRPRDAIACYRRALQNIPESPHVDYNISVALLKLGYFEEGFDLYRARRTVFPHQHVFINNNPDRLWSGYDFCKIEHLCIVAEQGLGDMIQFMKLIRFLPKINKMSLLVPGKLRYLAETAFQSDGLRICESEAEIGDHEILLPIMDIPVVLAQNNIIADLREPHLRVSSDRIDLWRRRLLGDSRAGLIALNWRGSDLDRRRDLPCEALVDMVNLATPGFRKICVQKDVTDVEKAILQKGDVIFYPDLDRENAFQDTAEILALADCVVSSDTSVIHLAAGLGRPSCLLLPSIADWRWLEGRSDSPWYPRLRLFRQSILGQWSDVFQSVHGVLRTLGDGRPA